MTSSHHLTIRFFASADRVAISRRAFGSDEDQEWFVGQFFTNGALTLARARNAPTAEDADRILTEDFIEGSGIRWMISEAVAQPTMPDEELDRQIAWSSMLLRRFENPE